MPKAIVTGGSGFLGSVLIDNLLSQGYEVYSISRRLPESRKNLIRLQGDILSPGLGLPEGYFDNNIDACYHLAAVLKLGEDADGMIMKTNVEGTRNVLTFCEKHQIPDFYYCSTAYTQNRNAYEVSKSIGERLVLEWSEKSGSNCAIFKPSIIIGIGQHYFYGHFLQFISLLIRILKRHQIVRHLIFGVPCPQALAPVFCLRGNPDGYLNLVDVEDVARYMAKIKYKGTYWLTNPNPPKLVDIAKWIGEYIMVDLRMKTDFEPAPLESQFAQMASAFQPYLNGESVRSHIVKEEHISITRDYIRETIRSYLMNLTSAG